MLCLLRNRSTNSPRIAMNTTQPMSLHQHFKDLRLNSTASKSMKEAKILTWRQSTTQTKLSWIEIWISKPSTKLSKNILCFWLNKTRTCKENWTHSLRLMTLLEETWIEKRKSVRSDMQLIQLFMILPLWSLEVDHLRDTDHHLERLLSMRSEADHPMVIQHMPNLQVLTHHQWVWAMDHHLLALADPVRWEEISPQPERKTWLLKRKIKSMEAMPTKPMITNDLLGEYKYKGSCLVEWLAHVPFVTLFWAIYEASL